MSDDLLPEDINIENPNVGMDNTDEPLLVNETPANGSTSFQEQITEDITPQDNSASGGKKPQDDISQEEIESESSKQTEGIPRETQETEADREIDQGTYTSMRDVHGHQVNVAQTIQQYSTNVVGKITEEGKPRIHSLDKIWEKIEEIFVYPPGVRDRINQLEAERRLLMIYGAENSGRLALSVRVGLDLLKKAAVQSRNFKEYNRTRNETSSLLDFVDYLTKEENKDKQPTVYIIRNAFRNGIDLDELNDEAKRLENALFALHSYLIFTVDDTSVERLSAAPFTTLPATIGHEQIDEVFGAHLKRYSKPGSERSWLSITMRDFVGSEPLRGQLVGILKRPVSIDRFFDGLPSLNIRGEIEDAHKVENFALSVSRLEYEPARFWFQKLQPNTRLFTLMVYLFGGFDRLLLNRLYTDAVNFLRQSGIVNLRDAREFGLNDILQEIHARENGSGLIEFEHISFHQEVGLQVENYYHQLWMLMPPFLTIFKQTPFTKPQFWYERAVIGASLARVGIFDRPSLEIELEALALHDNGAVVAIAGSALNELCRMAESFRRSEYYTFLLDILQGWSTSKQPDKMWAVAASVWRVYDSLTAAASRSDLTLKEPAQVALDEVDKLFTQLAQTYDEFSEHWRQQLLKSIREQVPNEKNSVVMVRALLEESGFALNNLKAIVHAVQQIFQNNPRRATDLVKQWLEKDANNKLKVAGILAVERLFLANNNEEIRLNPERHKPLLELIGPLLRASQQFDNLIEQPRQIVETLLVWMNHGDKEWTNWIHTELLRVVNRASRQERMLLRAVLSDIWLRSTSEDARAIGQALVARSLVMDGEPLALPQQRAGLIVFDMGRLGRLDMAGPEAARHLFELLDPRVDIQAGVLGLGKIPINSISDMANYEKLLRIHPHAIPRLLYPTLEPLDMQNYFFVLVLMWGDLHDLPDVLETAWHDQMLLIRTINSRLQTVTGTVTKEMLQLRLQRGWHLDVLRIQDIARVIGNRLARSLAMLSSAEWWQPLSEYLMPYLPEARADIEPDAASVAVVLDDLVSRMDEIEYARHPRDVTRTIACALLWMAKANFSAVIDLVTKWLSDTRDDLHPLMGSAGAQLLFNLYGYAEPMPSSQTHEKLLYLLPSLAHNLVEREHGDGISAALTALRHWICDSAWYERVMTAPPGEKSEIFQLIDECRPKFAKSLYDLIEKLTEPLIFEGEEETPATIKSWLNQLQVRLALGSDDALPNLIEGQSYGLVVVDAGSYGDSTRRFLLVSRIIRHID